MKKNKHLLIAIILIYFSINVVKAQSIPEILYYKFDGTGNKVPNKALNPPAGTDTAYIIGAVTQGNAGQCGGALVGSGIASSTDYVNTNWNTNLFLTSWTISFWTSNITSSSPLFYIWGDVTAGSLRCFTNGVAGVNNWILRGGGMTDILVPGAATAASSMTTFVYDKDSLNVKAYLNGTLVNTVTQPSLSIVGTQPFKISGYATNVGLPAGGLMDEFRIYNRALSQAEIMNIYLFQTMGTDSIVACDSLKWIDGNTYYSDNDTAKHIIIGGAFYGCDSLVNLKLKIKKSTYGLDSITACDSLVWIDGNTYYTDNNIAKYTITNAAGCDSIVTLNLKIKNSTFSIDNKTACDSLVWIDGNTYYTDNNTAKYILTNAIGCDSIITLNLTINNSNFGIDNIEACDSLTWIDGNTYYANNNSAKYILTNATGCDSIVSLNLTINNSNFGIDNIEACDSLTWIDGITYYANNNTAKYTITNTAGCDSIVSLNLTITSIIKSLTINGETITSNENNGNYQWFNCNTNSIIVGDTNQSFTATSNGSYAVIISKGNCIDTTQCQEINTVGFKEVNKNKDVVIYPNPSNGVFKIDVTTDYIATIYDALGVVILNKEITKTQKNLDLTSYGKGIYFIHLYGEKTFTVKVIVE